MEDVRCTVYPSGHQPDRHPLMARQSPLSGRGSPHAMSAALSLDGLIRRSRRRTRALVTGRVSITNDWPTLRRWCKDVRAGSLFRCVRPVPPTMSEQMVAQRAAATLAASAPPCARVWPLGRQAVLAACLYDDVQGQSDWDLRAPPTLIAWDPTPRHSIHRADSRVEGLNLKLFDLINQRQSKRLIRRSPISSSP